jgi:hypothetical protein
VSKEDLWSVVGRAKFDPSFAFNLVGNFARTAGENGYSLDPTEIEAAKLALADERAAAAPAGPGLADLTEEWRFQQQKSRERYSAQVDRMIDLSKFTAQILKDTISHAANTYKAVTRMNQVMFWMGVVLFVIAVAEGLLLGNVTNTIAFAGLGTVSFIGFFLLGPIQKTQAALSKLIQAEIAFMTYFEQITFWENYALVPKENSGMPDPARIETASALLQRRSRDTIELLHRYVEGQRTDTPPAAQPLSDADGRDVKQQGAAESSAAEDGQHQTTALTH